MDFNILTFPFAQAAGLLRQMSLSGSAGNMISTLLFLLFCLLPSLYLVFRLLAEKKEFDAIDLMLPAASVLLIAMMYLFINPGYLYSQLYGAWTPGRDVAMCVAFWTLLLGYILLRIMKNAANASEQGLTRALKLILAGTAALIGGKLTLDLVKGCFALSAAAKDTVFQLSDTFLFAGLPYFAERLPSVLSIVIIVYAIRLITQLQKDRYHEDTIAASKKLGRICTWSVIISIIVTISVSLLRFLFWDRAAGGYFEGNIPVASMILAVSVLLLSKYFAAEKDIKEENDLFI